MTKAKTSNRRLLDALLREDLTSFIAKVVNTVRPGDVYLYNWHIDAVAHALTSVYNGHIRRLCINQPPRSLKTISASVAFPAWCLLHDPTLLFACASYSLVAAEDFARQFRAVITSDWFKELCPYLQFSKLTDAECVTTKGGGRVVIPVEGSFTGRGADIIIIDDPIKAADAQSEKLRRAVNDWYGETLVSRLQDKRKGGIILTMQRLHEDDLAGTVLRRNDWAHLNLPAIAEEDQEIPIGLNKVHRRKVGDVLHPEREPRETLDQLKLEMGSIAFSAQYQQKPVPFDGNLIKRSWIRWYDSPPIGRGGEIVQSWDVASSISNTGDWSVCTTWLMLGKAYYLLNVWRGRLEYPELRARLIALAHEFKPSCILIERAGPGMHLVQEFRANPEPNFPCVIGINVKTSKQVRMEAQCASIQAGQFYLPRQAPWLDPYLFEFLAFPNSRNDDQIDSTSQFLNWAGTAGGIPMELGLPFVG